MSNDEREVLIDLLGNAINRLDTDVNYTTLSDEETKSWINIYKELLSAKYFGPSETSPNKIWLSHLKHIRPYVEVYGVERGLEESRKLRAKRR